jgi:multidrug efflux system membrane fusion protein
MPIAGRSTRAAVTVGNVVNEQVVLTSIAASKVYAYLMAANKPSALKGGIQRRQPGGARPNEQGFLTKAALILWTTASIHRLTGSACAQL